jgi:hypothetical protein
MVVLLEGRAVQKSRPTATDNASPPLPLSSTSGTRISLNMGLLLLAAAGIPLSLIWDFSWESTVGVDRFWSPPHAGLYISIALTALFSASLAMGNCGVSGGLAFGKVRAPFGAWICLWGALAYLTATIFDQWWLSAYGLDAGIWHPPQMLKAVGFFAILIGIWLLCWRWRNGSSSTSAPRRDFWVATGGGLILAMITVVMLPSLYPNWQHSAAFYLELCGVSPLVLVPLAMTGNARWLATKASAVYMGLVCSMVWVLPLFPAKPLTGPIYNALDHLMPPPFPLLLVIPAVALDLLWFVRIENFFSLSPRGTSGVRGFSTNQSPLLHPVEERGKTSRAKNWLLAGTAGLVFFLSFFIAQWMFAEFLLDAGDDRFFAGGGKYWPFFFKIDAPSRVAFWTSLARELDFSTSLLAIALAMLSSRFGVWMGRWMNRLQR